MNSARGAPSARRPYTLSLLCKCGVAREVFPVHRAVLLVGMGRNFKRPVAGTSCRSVADDATRLLRRSTIVSLVSAERPALTACAFSGFCALWYLVCTIGFFATIGGCLAMAMLNFRAFAFFRGNVAQPRSAKQQVKRWSQAFVRNVATPLARLVVERWMVSLAVVSALAELDKAVGTALAVPVALTACAVGGLWRSQHSC